MRYKIGQLVKIKEELKTFLGCEHDEELPIGYIDEIEDGTMYLHIVWQKPLARVGTNWFRSEDLDFL